VDYMPKGSMFVVVDFDQSVVPTHPKTGERMPPPESIVALCKPEAIGWTRARLSSLVSSTGWLADIHEEPLYKEDAEEGEHRA
jgi:hypothetical protein